jgi:5-oxoprolinase (ATP-hydrolysing)
MMPREGCTARLKERLGFSCAIFDAQGWLVANAPGIPINLGAMDEGMQTVLRVRRGTLKLGDVITLKIPIRSSYQSRRPCSSV